jgi:hypothetical protein
VPCCAILQVFVTKTDDDAIVAPALQDAVVESLVVQFLGCVTPKMKTVLCEGRSS